MIKFIINQETLINPDFDASFNIFLNEHYESVYDAINQEEVFSDLSNLNDFKKHLIDTYISDKETFFDIITKAISANIGFEDYFEPLCSYNFSFKDWKNEHNDKNESDFYDIPYSYLDDVNVFAFKTKNILCIYHDGSVEYRFYELYKVEHDFFSAQLDNLIKKIMSENGDTRD
jgi:hypothetical protein